MTQWTKASQASLSLTISWSLPKFMSIELAMPSNHLILCHSLLLLPSIFSSIRIFFNELALHMRSPKYWSFSITINPSNEYLGLISFKIDLFDLAVQGTLKTLLQHHSLKASILYDSTLRSIHDYWRYHSLDYMDLCWQTDFFNFFLTHHLGFSQLSGQEAIVF